MVEYCSKSEWIKFVDTVIRLGWEAKWSFVGLVCICERECGGVHICLCLFSFFVSEKICVENGKSGSVG